MWQQTKTENRLLLNIFLSKPIFSWWLKIRTGFLLCLWFTYNFFTQDRAIAVLFQRIFIVVLNWHSSVFIWLFYPWNNSFKCKSSGLCSCVILSRCQLFTSTGCLWQTHVNHSEKYIYFRPLWEMNSLQDANLSRTSCALLCQLLHWGLLLKILSYSTR